MANYSDIKGFTVQTLSSDTAASAINTGSWASGGSKHSKYDGKPLHQDQASSSAALVFAGYTVTAATGKTESYDGSSWTEVNDCKHCKTICFWLSRNITQQLYAFGGEEPGSPDS
jgi:hypothetical protein